MIVQKIEKKQVKSCDVMTVTDENVALVADPYNTHPCPLPDITSPLDHKKEAIFNIESAIEHLAELSECPECLESIGNLSIVLMDLRQSVECVSEN